MTDIKTPQSKAQLRDRIATIVQQAEADGANVEGAYQFPSTNGQHDWELQLFAVKSTEG